MIDVLIAPPQARKVLRDRTENDSAGDKPLKSLLKTVSWRVVGTLDTITISYIVTGELTSALSIGSIEVVTKMILYYFHERIWSRSEKFNNSKNINSDSHDYIRDIGSN